MLQYDGWLQVTAILWTLLERLWLHLIFVRTGLDKNINWYTYADFILEDSSSSNFYLNNITTAGGRLNKKDGLTRYGDSHVKDKTS